MSLLVEMIEPYLISSQSFLEPDNMSQAVGWVVNVGALGLGLGSVLALLVRRGRRLRKMQEHEHALLEGVDAKPLSPGPGRVVRGRIELDGADDVAFAVEIRQAAKDDVGNYASQHGWKEVSRTVRAVPFNLVRDDGVSVHVEPSEGALIVDSLQTTYPMEMPGQRVKRADARRGEKFYVYGDLVEGAHAGAATAYRDGTGWILQAPQGDRMLLATEAIRERYRGRIALNRKQAIAFAILFVVFHVLFTVPFVATSLAGEHSKGEVTGTSTPFGGHVLNVRAEDGFSLRRSVPRAVFDETVRAQAHGHKVFVPILRTRSWDRASFLGDAPQIGGLPIVFGTLLALLGLLFLWAISREEVPWYDRKKLDSRGGRGFWKETRPRAPIAPEVAAREG
jgi:hypothetical protein